MDAQPVMVADFQCELGEGPLWHEREQKLYWVDIVKGRIFRYDPEADEAEIVYEGDVIGGFTIQEDGNLLLFMGKGAIRVLRDGTLETVVESIPGEENCRFNDVFADSGGRVFCGTLCNGGGMGRLYHLNRDGTLKKILDDVGCSNGMGFTPDGKGMYYTDSTRRTITLFDYDESSGALTNRRPFIQVPDEEGLPDGMTVDAEGYVWSARWGDGVLVRYSPKGEEVQRIPFPAKKVTSVIFGGKDYRDIYVTTAGGNNREKEGEGAGGLFRLRLGIQGKPEYTSKVRLNP